VTSEKDHEYEKAVKVPATPQAAWRAVNQAVEAKVDPIGMTTPLLHAQLAWLSHPQEMSEALAAFSPGCGICRCIPGIARWAWRARMWFRRIPTTPAFPIRYGMNPRHGTSSRSGT
jgi:hypothetical protein